MMWCFGGARGNIHFVEPKVSDMWEELEVNYQLWEQQNVRNMS